MPPEDLRALKRRAQDLASRGRHDEAVRTFQLLVQMDPDDPMHSVRLGAVERARGRVDRAVECYRRAAALYERLGDAARARASFRVVLQMDSTDVAAADALVRLAPRAAPPDVLAAAERLQRSTPPPAQRPQSVPAAARPTAPLPWHPPDAICLPPEDAADTVGRMLDALPVLELGSDVRASRREAERPFGEPLMTPHPVAVDELEADAVSLSLSDPEVLDLHSLVQETLDDFDPADAAERTPEAGPSAGPARGRGRYPADSSASAGTTSSS